MNDEAIAEHIIYLVKQYEEHLKNQEHMLYQMSMMAAQLSSQDMVHPDLLDKTPSSKLEATTLVDRVKATLENRKKSKDKQ